MSWNAALEPDCPDIEQFDRIETLIIPRARDLGGFEVRRVLPSGKRQMVGPFIFFDQMGPATFAAGQSIDVRPHPHIGLATVTYLFEGSIFHRDSLGSRQEIHPGAVNWMIAGRGITHSERATDAVKAAADSPLFGIQTWIALPEKDEETDPAFEHHPKETLPYMEEDGKQIRLILGTLHGERAPVKTFSEMFYADAVLAEGARLPLPDEHEDRGIYIASGEIEAGGERYSEGQMLVFRPGGTVTVAATQPSRLMLLGGAVMDGPRHIWWNFVATSKDKIEAARQAWRDGDWEHGRFQLPPDDNDEFIPAPDR